MNQSSADNRAALAATLAAAAMIAQQVGGKATRDALFLSTFGVQSLPAAVMVSAVLSILGALAAGKLLSAVGTSRVVPAAFTASGLLAGVEWALHSRSPDVIAAAVFLHVTVVNSILISWFWSLVTERFDPRTARQRMSRIAMGATLGGVVGGFAAERVGADLTVPAMLPILGALNLLAAGGVVALVRGYASPRSTGEKESVAAAGFQSLREHGYLRQLATLVVLGTVAAACLDYVFKAEAEQAFSSGQLMRFFAVFYTGLSLVTFLVQTGLSRVFLERLGLGKTVGTLPAAVTVSSLGALFVPGLAGITAARGLEGTLRSSLFRSGYELLYSPISPGAKRATKTLIDVGFDRFGDALGAAMVQLLLLLDNPGLSHSLMLLLAAGVGIRSIWGAMSLQRGYVKELEQRLLDRKGEVHEESDDFAEGVATESGTWTTMAGLDVTAVLKSMRSGAGPSGGAAGGAGAQPAAATIHDPLIRTVLDLRSGEAEQVKLTLRSLRHLDTAVVPHVIRLLAWDAVSDTASRTLARWSDRITGQLADALLDRDEEFSIRRRIPRIMAAEPTERAVRPLFEGLGDRRFEVRFQCGRALARLQDKRVRLGLTSREVFEVVQGEVQVDRRVWEGHRLLDALDDDESVFVDEVLRNRASRSLEHVFTLLSLKLPRDPLRVAFRGLHTEDRMLRGTALEYLESVLPSSIRDSLWPFLEGTAPLGGGGKGRSREEILESLLESSESIQVNLTELRKKLKEEGGGAGARLPRAPGEPSG